uniref:Uncharacterized protein n=1 Tax=Eiseniibacteriota bacterium TaxID=2212470 RepID=A0A832MIX9_UNCEI
MIQDPTARGEALARFFASLEASLFAHLEESGLLPAGEAAAAHARREWECLALYACVRGLVAAGGFNRETAAAVDALHAAVLASWRATDSAGEPLAARSARVAERYAEYGAIGAEGGAAGAASVARRLGEAWARHAAGPGASDDLVELAGALHEALAEGAAEAVRRGTAP